MTMGVGINGRANNTGERIANLDSLRIGCISDKGFANWQGQTVLATASWLQMIVIQRDSLALIFRHKCVKT